MDCWKFEKVVLKISEIIRTFEFFFINKEKIKFIKKYLIGIKIICIQI